ncbi:DNA-directed RNA polymerase [Echinococcus multilocularis]|uniref:DNA-directed RNA polymerase n=1 Tax=Echinococcus multilocularis TaxID=6211 RepID=A0A068Y6V2_ECHMU|nr:DNA-directed RNA polymerase [Echinococcus multilocularis]
MRLRAPAYVAPRKFLLYTLLCPGTVVIRHLHLKHGAEINN